MSRKKKLLLNMGMGLLKQAVVTICGFILPRYLLVYYGSSVYGLISSITHFLGFISLLEMGIGPVIQSNLYKPLAEKNNIEISKVIISAERFFRKIAFIFLIYIVVLFVIFPKYIDTTFDFWYTGSLLVIIAISTFAEYYFGMTYQILLNSDQKSYIQLILQIVTVVLNTALSIVFISFGMPIHVVKLVSSIIFVLRPLGQMLYVKRNYSIDKTLVLTEEPIKQKWNGFSQHLASVVRGNIDVVLLTFFSSWENISIYTVYHTITNGVYQIIYMGATGIESLFGNMIARNEKETLVKTFGIVELLFHFVITTIFSVAIITIVPFVQVYTRGVNDADYVSPLFSVMLCCAFASQALKIPYFRVIKAAGKFKETQNGAFISMGLNIVISIVLIFRFGLAGIALGTLVSMLYHTCYFAFYLRNNILFRPIRYFILYIVVDFSIGALSYFITKCFSMASISYLSWFLFALKVFAVTFCISLFAYSIFGWKHLANLKKMLN